MQPLFGGNLGDPNRAELTDEPPAARALGRPAATGRGREPPGSLYAPLKPHARPPKRFRAPLSATRHGLATPPGLMENLCAVAAGVLIAAYITAIRPRAKAGARAGR